MSPSDSSAVKPHTHEIYNGSGEVSCTFFLSHTDGLTSKGLSGSVYLYGKGEDVRSGPVYQKDIGEDTLAWLSMMDCRGCLERSILWYRGGLWVRNGLPYDKGEDRPTKGWVCGVTEKGSDWLGSYTGPHTKEVWTGKYARLVTWIRSLMGKAVHLCRV